MVPVFSDDPWVRACAWPLAGTEEEGLNFAVFTKKRDGKNGRAVEAGGQHWCFGRQEQHWQLTQSKTPLKSITRKALPERPVKADRKSGDWQKSQDWAGPYTHDFWWWLNTVLHTDHPQTMLEDHKAQELRGLHSDRTQNFLHWEKQLPNSASFVCQWKVIWQLCNTVQRTSLQGPSRQDQKKDMGKKRCLCSMALPHLFYLLESPIQNLFFMSRERTVSICTFESPA